MNERTSPLYPVKKLSRTNDERSGATHQRSDAPYRRPFWLSVTVYYGLAAAAAAILFLFIWIILHEGDEEFPMLIAAVTACGGLFGAVILREIFLRKTRQQYLLIEKNIGYTANSLPNRSDFGRNLNKISLETNAEIIKEIKKKSEAAQVLGTFSESHRDVFEMCHNYLAIVGEQMETVGVGSPRLAGLRRGREVIGKLHHFHLLAWAEAESRNWSQKAGNYATIAEKLNAAQETLNVLNAALRFYPSETRLLESESLIKNFIASVKVSHWTEQAERAAFKGNDKRAVNLYRDALFFLARENENVEEREAIAAKINAEIEKLRERSQSGKREL